MVFLRSALLLLAFCFFLPAAFGAQHHLFFRIVLGKQFSKPVSGRLLLFLKPGFGASRIDPNPFHPKSVYVAAKEIHDLAPGSAVEIDTDAVAFPSGFSQFAPGDYQAQALVDVNHSYTYNGRGPGDIVSPVVRLPHFSPAHSPEPTITLDATVPEPGPLVLPGSPTEQHEEAAHVHKESFVSPALSHFWGRPITMRAYVLTPPGYEKSSRKYPVVYFTQGFEGNMRYLHKMAAGIYRRMADSRIPPMLWILVDESCPEGTDEFADSANDGPWGKALTTEFMPYLESRYRVDRRAAARFLTGHSSGGWATLWLQVNYPKIFGGTWSTSPDPSDFHDFSGIDLYAPHANMYHKPDGSPYPLARANGKILVTFKQYSHFEAVLGPYGGQMASFEWVFSPKGPSGAPMQLFDRATGAIHPNVARAWEKYDISRILASHWTTLKPYLNGKIHVIVGTADTFYLDG
ncbi:MAG: alpha/beta hydrolase, partial [Bryobacteraceae bacterium]